MAEPSVRRFDPGPDFEVRMSIAIVAITVAILAALLGLAFLAGLALGLIAAVVGCIRFAECIENRLDGGWTEVKEVKPDDDDDSDRWKRGDYSAN